MGHLRRLGRLGRLGRLPTLLGNRAFDKERLDFDEGEDALAVLVAVAGEDQRHGSPLRAEVDEMVVYARLIVLLDVVHQIMLRKYLDV